MTRSGARSDRGEQTRRQLVAAAQRVLVDEGFGAATARRVAEVAGANQALVFYHFGSLQDLLLAALDDSSAARMRRYTEVLGEAPTLSALLRAPAQLVQEDAQTGHIRLLTQMMAGALVDTELRPAVAARVTPWVDATEQAVSTALRRSPLKRVLPPREVAYGVVALFVGFEVLAALTGSTERTEAVLAAVARAARRLDRVSVRKRQ